MYYQQMNEKREQTLIKMKQEMQQMIKKLNEQSAYIKKLENSLQHQSKLTMRELRYNMNIKKQSQRIMHIPFNSPLTFSHHSSTSNLTENMDMDETSLFRKPSNAPRLSLTSPPQDGRMGTVPHRISNQNMLTNHSASSASSLPDHTSNSRNFLLSQLRWKSPIFKPPTTFRHSSMSSLVNLPP
ncbi:hypothetical protein WMY93_009431 [Mugilogobius chulae]|uniref:Uncharacterized protein n=1 Tax=Mugilogobius chulae TaxID=88201 RepID=A0AAW0PQ71_9GOBI